MTDALNQLKVNLLGRLLGHKDLYLAKTSLSTRSNGLTIHSESIIGTTSFATLRKSWLGSEIALYSRKRTTTFKFLKNDDAEAFVHNLNVAIAKQIALYLTKVLGEFNVYVVKHYPRDSWIEQIASLCKDLHDVYTPQAALWAKYLDTPAFNKVKEIAGFHPVTPDKLRNAHEAYQLKQRQAFFDKVESNPLTLEQRLGVLRSNDRNMVLAAAGTGKTSVMVAKALDLIDRGLAKPSEILILAYNRAAAEELKERLTEKANKGNIALESSPQISTFHALGRQLLREAGIPTHMSVFTEDDYRLEQWVTQWIHGYIAVDPSRVYDLIELSSPPVDPFNFKTQAEYERYLRDNDFRTLNNERVKGYQELLIANFLYLNQIAYEYEPAYVSKRRIDVGFDYKPDFFITEQEIYLEHFGVDRQGNTRPDINARQYNESIRSKRALHKECGTTLIESYHYEWKENTLLTGLKQKLEQHGVRCNPMHPHDVFQKLNQEKRLSSWSGLMKKALQAIRVERLSQEQILARLIESKIHQATKYAALLSALHDGYVAELQDQNAIDFDDMIIRAIQVIRDQEVQSTWKYVLVDEFQDISAARMEFIREIISNGPNPSLTVVGDDWQSIYRFSGGKLELTTRFGDLVGAYTSTKLQKTFRYNNSIANTAGQFIMENPEQYKKHIDTHTKVSTPQVYLLDDGRDRNIGLYKRVEEVVRKIRANDSKGVIAVIARYNYLLKDTKAMLWKAELKDNIEFWSFHKSKGLEADYCVLIGFFQGKSGFPNENRDEAIVEALLPSLDQFPHSEERRLMYVGITRAKKKSYIIADPTSPSEFITELLAPKYELNIASNSFQEKYQKTFKCPHCTDGFLRRVNGKYEDFYTCSTGHGCRVGKARVCPKCGSPSVDTRKASICNNSACGASIKLCPICGRPMKLKEGPYSKFWGCSGYGIKDDRCDHKEKIVAPAKMQAESMPL
ncbi:UvrD-helicase domain-containing protein [Ferrimonas kyonanensis]|uniref:UvrD-helicase domain-containing protein n=1 Tax=Ferrimonas kyonanensis TaxID=364763 RepID=UPI00040FB61A|nr:UvrD-helicase domain-containing protein [Ferrimonas kyonanensis]